MLLEPKVLTKWRDTKAVSSGRFLDPPRNPEAPSISDWRGGLFAGSHRCGYDRPSKEFQLTVLSVGHATSGTELASCGSVSEALSLRRITYPNGDS